MNLGDAMSFTITDEHYPIYDINSLLNTNPNFDYSAFNKLPDIAASLDGATYLFVFTFLEAGIY